MSRNIVIYPNRNLTGSTDQPYITFSGLTTGTIKLVVEDDGDVVYEGNTGALFGIEDNKEGLLHSVNDVSGLPIFSVFSNDLITAGIWDDPALIVSGETWNILLGSDQTIDDTVNDTHNSILGGSGHTISNSYGVISGGRQNTLSALESFIGGGLNNNVASARSVIVGGKDNSCSVSNGFIGGGIGNIMSSGESILTNSAIGAGVYNGIYANSAFIGGGEYNKIQNLSHGGVIAGGYRNQMTGLTTGNYGNVIGGGDSLPLVITVMLLVGVTLTECKRRYYL
jgi:hypothetical protein